MRNLSASVREKPLPVLLAGIGIAWLMASGSTSPAGTSRTGVSPGPDMDALIRRARGAGEAVTRSQDETEDAYRLRVAEARGGVLGLTRSAQETTASFTDRVEQALAAAQERVSAGIDRMRMGAHDVVDALGDRVSQAREVAGDRMNQGREALGSVLGQGREAGARLGDGMAHTGDSVRRMSDNLLASFGEHPMVLGAIGVAAGAILGSLLPRTELEDQLLGGTKRELRDSAQDAVQGAMESGGRVAQAAMEAGRGAVREATREGGLGDRSLRDLGGKVQEVGERVLHAGQHAAEKEGLISGETGHRAEGDESARAGQGGTSGETGRGGSSVSGSPAAGSSGSLGEAGKESWPRNLG